MPTVSIIIPTFNRSNLISRAIRSVLSQSMRDFELIIVDDGSKDNTAKVISSFSDDRIKYFKQEYNSGQNSARNIGISKAKGQFFAFLDSDDEWLKDFLEKTLSVLEQDKTLGAVYSRAFGCNNGGELYDGYQFDLEGDVYKKTLEQGYLSYMITIVIKRDIIDLLLPDPFDPDLSYGDDDDFCFRIAKICRIGLIKEPLAIIHNDGDVTGSEPSICKNYKLIADGRKKLINKYKDDILKYCGKDTLASKYLSLGIVYLRSGNIEMAKHSFQSSFDVKKTLWSSLYIIYSKSSFIRKIWNFTLDIYRFLKDNVKRLYKFLFRSFKRQIRHPYI